MDVGDIFRGTGSEVVSKSQAAFVKTDLSKPAVRELEEQNRALKALQRNYDSVSSMAAADREELVRFQQKYEELERDFIQLRSEHRKLQNQISEQETQHSASSGEQARLERQLKELQRGKAKLAEASEASDQQIKDLQQLLRAERSKTGALTLQLATAHKATEDRTKEAEGLKQSLAAKTAEAASNAAALAAATDDLKLCKDQHGLSEQQLEEEKRKVLQLEEKVNELEIKQHAAELHAATLEQHLSHLKKETETADAARQAEHSRLTDLEARLTDEQARNLAAAQAAQRHSQELKQLRAVLDAEAGLLEAVRWEVGEDPALHAGPTCELEDAQLVPQIQVLVSERRTFLQEVATLKQCKEKLEATLLQERQRAADGLAAFEAAERRMSVEQMSSLKIEQERAAELRMLQELSSSQAVELQQLGKQLTSSQQQLKAEMEEKEAKEAEVQQLLKERDEQRRANKFEDAEKARLVEKLRTQEVRLAEAMDEKFRLEVALQKAQEEVRTALDSQRVLEEGSAVEIKELCKKLEEKTTEVAALRNSLLDAQQDYENLQSQVASQKAHDAKVQLEKQKLEEDLKAERDRIRKLQHLQREAEKKEHQEESARWAAKMADLQTDLGAATEKLTKCQAEISKLEDQLEQARALEAEHQRDAQRWATRAMELESSSGILI